MARPIRDIGLAAVLVAAALALAACGGGGDTTVTRTATANPATAPGHRPTHRPKAAAGCRLGGFLQALKTLESNLAVGLSYEQYFAEVKRAKDAYAAVPVAKLELPCLIAQGTPAEKALNEYIEAANAWRECRADAGCGTYAIEPRLQRMWRVASHYIALTGGR